MQTETRQQQADREVTLAASGLPRRVPLPLAKQLSTDGRYDLHGLIELVERGCRPDLAVGSWPRSRARKLREHRERRYRAGHGARRRAAGRPGVTRDLDAESLDWLRTLRADGAERDAAVGRLHGLLLHVPRFEVSRRRASLAHIRGDELDDIALERRQTMRS